MNVLVDNEELIFIKNNRVIGFVNELASRFSQGHDQLAPQSISRYFKVDPSKKKKVMPEPLIKEARKLLKEQTGLTYKKQL